VRLAGDEPDFLFLLGQAAARQEQFEEAAEVYSLFLRRAPKIDGERRARIKAIIDLCRALVGLHLYLRTGADTVVLPLEFSAGYLPLVSVTIDGKGPFRFAIDTGSGFMVISEVAAAKLKIRPIAKGGTSQGVGGEGKFPLVYGLIHTLGLGDLRIDNVPTYIRKFHHESADPVDGYIGLSILARFQSAIDYGNRRFELKPFDAPLVELGPGDVALSYQVTAGGMLSVPTDINAGGLLNFVVDTGASTSVVSTAAYTRYDLKTKLDTRTARVVGAAGVTEGVPTVVLDSLSVPSTDPDKMLRRGAVRAVVLDLTAVNETAGFQVAGIIGGNVLRDYRLELDTTRGRLVLRPNRPPPAAPAGSRERGVPPRVVGHNPVERVAATRASEAIAAGRGHLAVP
jgi:predicted aspartyl protease